VKSEKYDDHRHYAAVKSAKCDNHRNYAVCSRSQWPRSLGHELSSSAQTLGSWVRILLRGMDVCVCFYSVFVLFCVQVAALVLPSVKNYVNYYGPHMYFSLSLCHFFFL
jgi:hypothetical protein